MIWMVGKFWGGQQSVIQQAVECMWFGARRTELNFSIVIVLTFNIWQVHKIVQKLIIADV